MSAVAQTRPTATASASAVFQSKARTFWFATRFLPADRRPAVTALYLFARTMDDLVDEPAPGRSGDDVRRELAGWRRWLESDLACAPPNPDLAAVVRPAFVEHGVPPEYLVLLLDGVSSDLDSATMATWPELRAYCFKVASSVGLAMCHILGAGGDPVALRAAAELGVAMQLTNILRDVGSDLALGRVYLPLEDLDRHRYSVARLRTLAARLAADGRSAMDDDFRRLAHGQVARARAHYERGLRGVWSLPGPCRVSILLAGQLYRAILDEIEAADYDVFTRRASTSHRRKLSQALRCWSAVRWAAQTSAPGTSAPELAPAFQLSDWQSG